MKRLYKGGRVVDPSQGIDQVADLLVENGLVAAIGELGAAAASGASVVEVPAGFVLCPGFIDMHVHLREPGQEQKETIATGTAAAVAGGFTAVACMPNTDPVNDEAGVTRLILEKAGEAALARVYPIGCVTKGSKGETLAEMADLQAAGCVAFSDDGKPVANPLIMRRALEYAGMLGALVIDHCESPALKGDGVAHEGTVASVLGLRGIPSAAEEVMVARDVVLAGMIGSRAHIAHLSTRGALDIVRHARARGVRVSCEATPHHLVLTDERLAGPLSYDTNCKMNPPLREEADREALIEGLADGSIDAIATDHAPHHWDDKHVEFDRAPFGIVGLETAVSLVLDRLVNSGRITLARMIELMSVGPARLLGVKGGSLAPGAPADLTVLVPGLAVTIRKDGFRSKARNTPFDGWTLTGGVAATIVGGRAVYVNQAAAGASAFDQ